MTEQEFYKKILSKLDKIIEMLEKLDKPLMVIPSSHRGSCDPGIYREVPTINGWKDNTSDSNN